MCRLRQTTSHTAGVGRPMVRGSNASGTHQTGRPPGRSGKHQTAAPAAASLVLAGSNAPIELGDLANPQAFQKVELIAQHRERALAQVARLNGF